MTRRIDRRPAPPQPGIGSTGAGPARPAEHPPGDEREQQQDEQDTGSHTIANQIAALTIVWPAPMSVANAASTSEVGSQACAVCWTWTTSGAERRDERPERDLVLELGTLALELLDLAADLRQLRLDLEQVA